ncbi:MAG TPA: preprotein translocase subunit SecG [Gemmataceae bacterium]|nr:preprotein translocase subunit SecG [Gemmataceae bacterium]
MTLLGVSWYVYLLNAVVLLTGLILIGIILIQRGKGGGLAGAFGGVGGSSPFGSRAGDLFTRITLIVAAVWAVLIVVEVKLVQIEGRYVKEHPSSIIK